MLKVHIMIAFSLIFTFRANSYEWNQLTEAGVINKVVMVKKEKTEKELNFSNLFFKKKLLNSLEIQEKFPFFTKPRTIVIMGDSGCRLKESKGGSEYQNCNDPRMWPLAKIAEEAKKENPDLIIHLGDYHYREQCSFGKPCEKMSLVVGYGWQPWELDFFQPMQKLLEKAPVIIVRGNHEDCNRAFLGYKFLLSNTDWEKDCIDYEPAQIMTLGDIAIINFDSSAISEIPFEGDESIWIKRLNDINEKIEKLKIKKVWFVTHKPIYGIIPFKFALFPGNINFRRYFEKSLLKDKVSLLFGGHIHTSMVVVPKKYGKQIILGNSGTKLENFNLKLNQSLLNSFSYESAHLVSNEFGYAVIKKSNDAKWSIVFKDSNGIEIYRELLDAK